MSKNLQRLLTRMLLLALSFAMLSATEPLGFPTNEDMRHFRSINDPRLSPDGRQVLFRIVDPTADGAKSHLWLVDVTGNNARQLTWSPDSDKTGETRGEWMPDGSLLFIAHRSDHNQIFRLPMNGGEARPFDIKVQPVVDESRLAGALPPVTESEKNPVKTEPIAIDAQSFRISPDGKTIAVIARDPQTPGEKKQADAKADAVWVNHDLHGKRVWFFDPANQKVSPVSVAPDVQDVVWSNNSTQLFVIKEEPNEADDLGPATSGWLVDAESPAKAVMISGLPQSLSAATWSRDDKVLHLVAQAEKDAPPGYREVFAYDLVGRKVRNLTDGFEGAVQGQAPIPLPDGAILQGTALGVGTGAMRIDREGHRSRIEFTAPVTNSFHTNVRETGWVFLGSSSTQPTALYYSRELAQPALTLKTPDLTPANSRSVESHRIQWKSDNLTVEGLLYLPQEASQHRVPLIVEVHGGPTGAYVDGFDPFVNFLVGHGWAVLRSNPRGSTNYGATFAAANKNDLGGGDYRDIMAGVDFVLKTQPIDPDRLALEGYSYGGEMAGFVEGKTTRFKAIISGAPVIDQYSEYGTESGSWYDRWFYGKPWEHPADAWRQSPLSGVAQAKTPFMLLQGLNDTTDPPGQALEMYRALRQMGVPVDLITYPRDNHGPLSGAIYGRPVQEPWHGFDARQRIVSFIQKAFGESGQ